MNAIKKNLGYIWMLLGPVSIAFLLYQAMHKLSSPSATTNDFMQWGIIILIFLPIAIGFVVFGFYATKGEYDMV